MLRGECIASKANSNTNDFVVNRNNTEFIPAPPSNAIIVVDRQTKTAYLIATKRIRPILVPYLRVKNKGFLPMMSFDK
jgi:hypothetical protein